MKKILLFFTVIAFLGSCAPKTSGLKSNVYKGMYAERGLAILIMPPINRSTNVEAKEYFHSTLNVPLANAGYYVIPPFLSMEILKKESAYDAELFLTQPLTKFGEIFGADLALFTIIHKWDKSGIAAKVFVEVEYVFKNVQTNEIVYKRRANVTYNAAVSSGASGGLGALIDITASAVNTAATQYVDVARKSNIYTFKDLPAGIYSPNFGKDGNDPAGLAKFDVLLNPNSK